MVKWWIHLYCILCSMLLIALLVRCCLQTGLSRRVEICFFSPGKVRTTILSFTSRSTHCQITFQILTSFKQSYTPTNCQLTNCQDVDAGIEIGAWIWSTKENGRCKMARLPVDSNSMLDIYCPRLVLPTNRIVFGFRNQSSLSSKHAKINNGLFF